jgi:hypothetical protein
MSNEDDSPSMVITEVYVEGDDIILGVTPEWKY